MRRAVLAGLLIVAGASIAVAQQEAFPPGEVVQQVACLAAPEFTYSLYLPGNYDTAKTWPILFIMDPRGRAPMALELFREGAERLGFILVSSYDTRSDMPRDRNIESLKALLPDTEKRLSIDTSRIYLTGFSGTARTAWVLAKALRGHVVGIIGIGGGLPAAFDPAQIPVVFFGGAGSTDFNYEEMRELDRSLDRTPIPHRFVVWEGPHSWPPAEVAGQSLEWMQLQAMKSGLQPKNHSWSAQLLSARLEEAQSLEEAGRSFDALLVYRAMEEDFAGLQDVAGAAARVRELGRSREVKRVRARQDRFTEEYTAYRDRFWSFVETLQGKKEVRMEKPPAFLRLEALLARAQQQEDRPDADAAQRILSMVFVQASFYQPTEFLDNGKPGAALAMLRIAAAIRPLHPRVCLQQSRTYAQLSRNKEALKSLRCALESGTVAPELVEGDAYLAPLRSDPAYRKILEATGAPEGG